MTPAEIKRRMKAERFDVADQRLGKALGVARAKDWLHQFAVAGIKFDFAFPRARLAIFVDWCFRHGCPEHGSVSLLKGKLKRQIETHITEDRAQDLILRAHGWRIVRVWEHELATDEMALVQANQIRVLARWLSTGTKHGSN